MDGTMVEKYLEQIATQGLLGIFLVILGYAYYRKDSQINELQEKRHQDLKCVSDKWAQLVGETNKTLQALTDAIGKIK